MSNVLEAVRGPGTGSDDDVPGGGSAPGVSVGVNAVVSDGVRLGHDVVVMPGAYIGPGSRIGDGVTVAPNAAIAVRRAGVRAPVRGVVVRDGATIGANSTLLDGVTVGPGAVVDAGAVVHRDVPANAIVTGSPAYIAGYVSSAAVETHLELRASAFAPDELPYSLGRATVVGMPVATDLRGSLIYAEVGGSLPFTPVRFFIVHSVPSREVRGEHAHRELHQFLLCVDGSCRIAVDDGSERGEVVLDRSEVGIHLPPMVWATQYDFSPDTQLLVLASDVYDEDDYIRDHDEFLRLVGHV